MFTLLTPMWLAACDVNEGPREEAREAGQAIERGASPGDVDRQLRDINGTPEEIRNALDAELRSSEAWLLQRRAELKAASEQAEDDTRRELDQIDRQLSELRTELDALDERSDWQKFQDRFREVMHDIGRRIDAIDGRVNDRPGKG
jgi:DNA anti-recombination protein RmuC